MTRRQHYKNFSGKERHHRRQSGKTSTEQKIKPGIDSFLKKIFSRIGVPGQKQFRPDAYQLNALEAVREADCLVTAPTGSGKTWIAVEAVKRTFNAGGKAWYTAPLKALSNEKYREFREIFGSDNVGIITGDRKENVDAPIIIGTTEILRNQLYDAMHAGTTLNTDFVVLDEAHFLGDPDRGVVWEEIMIYLPRRIPMLMLSATIGNADHIAGWLSSIRNIPCNIVEEHNRPVPLFPLFFHPSGTLLPLLAKDKKKMERKVASCLKQRREHAMLRSSRLPQFGDILKVLKKFRLLPAIFFLKSRADCDGALNMCLYHSSSSPEKNQRRKERLNELLETFPFCADHGQRSSLENCGVGSHHSGQLPAWKLILEKLMTEGLLDAVFATSTVAAGVNFPARTIVLLNSDRFNGVEFLPLNPTEFHQMTGRAGRRGMDKIGFALAVPGRYMDLRHVVKMLNAPPADVFSQIRINFTMVLNLLLSHSPDQVRDLLRNSFASYQMLNLSRKKLKKRYAAVHQDFLWHDFVQHLNFLIQTGFVTDDSKLTDDGAWASKLRVDQPLLLAEGCRRKIFPDKDPELLAAVMASFAWDQDFEELIDNSKTPKKLLTVFLGIKKSLRPFAKNMMDSGFPVRMLFLRPAIAVYLWSAGHPWEKILEISEIQEGNLAMLILRTIDNLRHLRNLSNVFPEIAATASAAIDSIKREPVDMAYY